MSKRLQELWAQYVQYCLDMYELVIDPDDSSDERALDFAYWLQRMIEDELL
jgi:hypothetical protein